MDIQNVSSGVASAQQELLQKEIGVRVMRLALDAQSAEGQQLVRMMNESTGIGGQVDLEG